MIWIVSASEGIVDNCSEMNSRLKFISDVTGCEVSTWKPLVISNKPTYPFCWTETNDGIDGVFITAHLLQVFELCGIPEVCKHEFIIANTCMMRKHNTEYLLQCAKVFNRNVKLYFAKQKVLLAPHQLSFYYVAFLNDLGRFGFPSTQSERLLFKNRMLGFREAINLSFDELFTEHDYR